MDQEELLGRVMALETVIEIMLHAAPQLRAAVSIVVNDPRGAVIDVGLLTAAPERALSVREERLRMFAGG